MNTSKVKAYGLISFTKKQYLITQTVVFAILLLFAVATLVDPVEMNKALFGNAALAILIVTMLEIGETYFMLKKFGQKR